MSDYVGRLAPSPTGLLHVGHAQTFGIAHARARASNGTLWLRSDNLDKDRVRPEFVDAMREDLQWLGITWDHDTQQSDRLESYRHAMLTLLEKGLVYPCICSRRDVQQSLHAPHEDTADEPVYAGTCRDCTTNSALLDNVNYRFRVPDRECVSFTDHHVSLQSFHTGCEPGADIGDFLVWRKDGLPSYQLACVVDDATMEITEVVRGRDLLRSTARQILLQRALGVPTPAYFHCDLVCNQAGVRLAKRHDALSLRALRASGMDPQDILAGTIAPFR